MSEEYFDGRSNMRPLAFLLGNWSGSTVVYPADGVGEPARGLIKGRVVVSLDGAWFEWDYFHQPKLSESLVRRARYSFGYSPGTSRLMATYADDRGNAMMEYAPASHWTDGHLTFEGSMPMPGMGLVGFVDDFTRPTVDTFRNTVTMTINGESHLHGTMDLSRI